MHSLPSRRRLPQPSFFRSKCYRLSPLPFSCTPPPLPAAPLPRLLPATHLPAAAPPPVSAHPLARTLRPAAARRQAGGGLPPVRGQTRSHTPGTVRQADALLHGAVCRQGGRTVAQSADRDSLIVNGAHAARLSLLQSQEDHPPPPRLPSLSH